MNYIYTIDELKRAITPLAQSYGVLRVILFGSYARGEANEQSDIDLHIVAGNVDFMEICALNVDLEEALQKKIGMSLEEYMDISDFIRNDIMAEGKVLYEIR